ncbi:hypothetical protein PACTADRAFT_49657 [Pachysolen tannophilus NRRL Y-2460]|uniref:Acid phosphatase n=1 Tax=Pachysolen tannophilus NRRL Y-2460 TaxID=669874 RepID=A0A1E4TX28_PACTA|nr:hypothetical protein PACTADRAFT_49657 [Pachysolen tannophilus NRRL Y-2460]
MKFLQLSILTLVANTLVAFADSDSNLNLDSEYSCVGTFIFGRHNDRNVKPATLLTTLGQENQYKSGQFYRERYFGLDSDNNDIDSDYAISGLNNQGAYIGGQFYGQVTSDSVLLFSHVSFLQGLYPPTTVDDTNTTLADETLSILANGSTVEGPLNGYQYVQTYVQEAETPNYIWIKGDVDCTSANDAIDDYLASDDFKAINESTLDYYQSLRSLIPEDAFSTDELNFGNAMSIFDYMNVYSIHNATLSALWNETLLYRVRVLADEYNWAVNVGDSDNLSNLTLGGQTLAGAIVKYLNVTKEESTPYINYFTGSYNTMFQIAGVLELNEASVNFTGMPEYGATLVFDLLKDTNDSYYVQFSFRNGTADSVPLTVYPLFGGSDTILSWEDFVSKMEAVSISSLDKWCEKCSATLDMCIPYSTNYEDAEKLTSKGVSLSEILAGNYSTLDISSATENTGLTLADAGGIGAGVTIGVFLILAALAFAFYKLYLSKKSKRQITSTLPVAEKRHSNTSSSQGSGPTV